MEVVFKQNKKTKNIKTRLEKGGFFLETGFMGFEWIKRKIKTRI